jgi:hypothetical protein
VPASRLPGSSGSAVAAATTPVAMGLPLRSRTSHGSATIVTRCPCRTAAGRLEQHERRAPGTGHRTIMHPVTGPGYRPTALQRAELGEVSGRIPDAARPSAPRRPRAHQRSTWLSHLE